MTDPATRDSLQVQPERFAEAFVRETRDLLVARLHLGLGVGIVLYMAFSVLDYFVVGAQWSAFLLIRGLVCLLAGGSLLLFRTETGRRYHLAVSTIPIFLGSLGISAMTWRLDGFGSAYFYGNMLVLFLVGLFIPWPVRLTAFFCALAVLTYAVPNLVLHGATVATALLPLFFLLGTAVLTCWATLAAERGRRTDLHQRMQLGLVNDQLTLADEMKTRFFSNVSHELRTPLMLILGPLDALIRGEAAGDPATLLRAMNSNAHRLLRQVNMILNFSRLEAGRQKVNWTPCNLASVLEELVSAALPYAERRRIDLKLEGATGLPDLYFDPEQIETVAANLLSNAMKFTPDGGRVTVRAGRDGEDLYWEVEDSGCGIPESELGRVFERFHQVDGGVKGKIQGTGLGLSLSRELILLHHGDISVRSTYGAGTTFRVRLPIQPPAEVKETLAAAEASGAPERAGDASGVKRAPAAATQFADLAGASLDQAASVEQPEDGPLLLVVEDNPDMRAFVANSLRRHYRVATAEDGEYGLEAARRLRPDLIVSDVMMPRLDGFGMVAALRQDRTFANTPIIMLTARTGSEAVVKGLSLGAVDYVNKPFKMIEIEARIAAQLRARSAEKALDERETRLIAVGQMTGTIAHDLRGPLQAIQGRIELVRMTAQVRGGLNEIEEDLCSVERTVRRVANMTQEIMEFVRGGSTALDRQPCDAAELVTAIANDMRGALAAAGVELELSVPPSACCPLEVDRDRLQRALENLINNARDAVNQADGERERRIWLHVDGDAAGTTIRIADNGPGIPAEVADRLFQPFATAGKAQGTGLGLSIVRNIVTAHGGTITVDRCPPEGGAAFEVRLPRPAAGGDEESPPAAARTAA